MNRLASNICFVLIGVAWCAAPRAEGAESVFHRGVCYVHSWRGGGGYGSEASADTLAQLDENHVDWIQLNPFGYQRTPNDTVVRSAYERRGAESDAVMARDVAQAHQLGMGVMLKPHIWISHGSWPGEIAFEKKADWDAWFDSYGAMMIHYAKFAEGAGVEYLCIGTELKETSSAQPERWRKLISKIRSVYEGRLVYAANWDEYARIPWWDDLDAIGVNAYFPLTNRTEPTLDQLRAGAQGFRDQVAQVQRKFRKPVIFTELGYRSEAGSAIRPWEHRESNAADFALQERCYEAIFQTFWDVEWLEGIYWWKWFSNSSTRPGQYDRDPFSPRNKPAEQVMSRWYARPRPNEDSAAR